MNYDEAVIDAATLRYDTQHGDVQTFRTCCRVVRGFALDDDEALAVLRDWNSHCEPPWSDRELIDKLSRARRDGREPIGGLLGDADTERRGNSGCAAELWRRFVARWPPGWSPVWCLGGSFSRR